jgi:histidinol-phosphatase (PHP family)
MIADCHMHTCFSSDSEADMSGQVEAAIERGIEHICFTDHMDMDYPGGEFALDTDAYMKSVMEVKEKYKDKIKVCFGIEVGLQEHLKERLQNYIDSYPFDFVIGSMHLIHGEDPYFGKIFDRYGDEETYREYFRALKTVLEYAPKVQSLGHLDYVVRYGKEKEKDYSYERFAGDIDAVLRLIIEKGIALEVNTAGYKTLPFTNPHRDIICRYRELGGEMITVGADAHAPEYVGYQFERIPELLKSCGLRYYTVFEGKKPKFIKL